jgi:uncharacterized membrane protein YgdD (TMEM256/DUF423 family)
MSERDWQSNLALVLFAAFVIVAIALLAVDKIELAHAAHDIFATGEVAFA